MIKTDTVIVAGLTYKHTESDANKFIVREDGEMYVTAYDPIDTEHTYTESDISLPIVKRPTNT